MIVEIRKLIASILVNLLIKVLPDCEFKKEFYKFILNHYKKL